TYLAANHQATEPTAEKFLSAANSIINYLPIIGISTCIVISMGVVSAAIAMYELRRKYIISRPVHYDLGVSDAISIGGLVPAIMLPALFIGAWAALIDNENASQFALAYGGASLIFLFTLYTIQRRESRILQCINAHDRSPRIGIDETIAMYLSVF